MKNEELVERIKNGLSVTADMQTLYENNLQLIKIYIKPYTAYEPLEDCLQEAYFGLWEAVKHYDRSENVLFMTYARFWIKQEVQRYIENCGSVLRIPNYKRQEVMRYKKTVQALSQELGQAPTDHEIARKMNITEKQLHELKMHSSGIASLDTALETSENITLCDTLQADFSLEEDVIDKIYEEYAESELWGIVEGYTDCAEYDIIKQFYIQNKTISEIAEDHKMTIERVQTIKECGLRKLRVGKAKRKILEKFEIADAGMYRSSLNKYKEHNFTSTVEFLAIRRMDIETEYRKRTNNLECSFEKL